MASSGASPSTFVLVSGSWHAAWCWERIVPLLEGRGHRAVAPDLLGMGQDRTPFSQVSLAAWADQVADLVREQAGPVILVGHSRGGIVISEAAERVPERIRTLVYLTAYMLPGGVSLAQAADPPRTDIREHLRVAADGGSTVAPEMVGPTFYNTTAPQWVARAVANLCPEPPGVTATPLALSAERFGRVPRAYIECLQDQAVPIETQRRLREALPCDPVITLDTDHSPFYSAPEALTAALQEIAGSAR